jgi:hypothetical protein
MHLCVRARTHTRASRAFVAVAAASEPLHVRCRDPGHAWSHGFRIPGAMCALSSASDACRAFVSHASPTHVACDLSDDHSKGVTMLYCARAATKSAVQLASEADTRRTLEHTKRPVHLKRRKSNGTWR